ncbi:Cof-type HAD-IIB family hydrolase [Virgibacillus sp. AGTR]|uniref:Cof-type HAD-IIB family hydrolase n=1 Tax=Virgibacillus TaxID=84406 RepID=UPI000EF48BBA|nr:MULTISPECIES: Cof-type HAD-IIB family hydrolase [Virgibacillus]MCC2252447.1 Cof-type HAD-IIB family hydrolase [Virgibacillus sp. AGTR]QRZ16583.1 HAD family phosphatase [Virgibacillus sp. AGTR]WBX79907.1 Cof-type HAD-IIB family hydrolase [Virgibacillus salarius]
MTKLIAIDLDGTLLNENNKISIKNLEAITSAQSKGIEVVIATGRAHFDVQTLFKDTGINTWIIGANGATIHSPDGKLYRSKAIQKQDAVNILNWLEKEDYYYEVFSNHAIYTPQHGRELLAIEIDRMKSANPEINVDQLSDAANKQFSQTGFSFIRSYRDFIGQDLDVYNVLAFSFNKEKLEKGRNHFKNLANLSIVSSAEHNFELEHIDASKGNALSMLAEEFRIELSETAAIGDSFNDLSMLEIAGKSAAMGNAPQKIKNSCQVVTLPNTEDGVAHFLHSLR